MSKIMKKVQLIQPSIPDIWEKDPREGCYPPLGLLSIATYLKNQCPECEIEILDGNILKEDELERKINGNILGVTVTTRTYLSAIKIAEVGKRKGAIVIFGGHHITAMRDELFRNKANFDVLVVYDGEIPFSEIVRGNKKENINNLIYKDGDIIKQTPIKIPSLDLYPMPSYGFVDYRQYANNYKKVFSKIDPFDMMTAVYSQKGCEWRDKTGGCLFCSRTDIGWRAKNPQKLWDEINYLKREFGKNILIRDVSDDFITNLKWFEEFHYLRPPNPGINLYIQVRPDRINKKTVRMLSEIGTYLVCLGIESGDQKILDRINKGITLEQNIKSIRLLKEYGINTRITLVLGNPEENEKSLKNTFGHVEKLIEAGNIQQIGIYMFQPFPGSRAFRELLEDPHLKNKYKSGFINLIQLEKDWVEKYCDISYEKLKAFSLELKKLVPYSDGHGWKINFETNNL